MNNDSLPSSPIDSNDINPVIAYGISILTIIIVFYILDPTLIINSIELMVLSFMDTN